MLDEKEVRKRNIEALLQQAEHSFAEYLNSPEFRPGSLELPNKALSVFIPREVYDLANDPNKVSIIPFRFLTDSLWLIIFEKDRKQEFFNQDGNFATNDQGNFGYDENKDLVFINFMATKAGSIKESHAIWVENYEDSIVLRNRGMSLGFYKNLELVAKRLGFSLIGGSNNNDNVTFFTGKLGRKRLMDSPEIWPYFLGSINGDPKPTQTYKFL